MQARDSGYQRGSIRDSDRQRETTITKGNADTAVPCLRCGLLGLLPYKNFHLPFNNHANRFY